MGNNVSLQHKRIYTNIINIQSPQTRANTIQTLLNSPEYVNASRQIGIYSNLLEYVTKVQRGVYPGFLPYEDASNLALQQQNQTQLVNRQTTNLKPYEHIMKRKSGEKALNYFQSSLLVLGLEENVGITEEELKKAYKKAAVKVHPDKGGTEEQFEAVTRSYAYLSEILKRMKGGREGSLKTVEAPGYLKSARTTDAEDWKQAEPVRLNADKLDLNAFNKLFEDTRIPEPDEDGYGDWLTSADGSSSSSSEQTPKFSGKFNRDVFHQMFDDDVKKQKKENNSIIHTPQELYLATRHGVELGRGKPSDFTTAANDSGLKYTDLRAAYTSENTFSGQIRDVKVEERNLASYQESRKRAPDPLKDHELEAISYAERQIEDREKQRQFRAAQEGIQAQDYHDRMRQLVITDGKRLLDVNNKKRG